MGEEVLLNTVRWFILAGLSTLEGFMERGEDPSYERNSVVSAVAQEIITEQSRVDNATTRSLSPSSFLGDAGISISRQPTPVFDDTASETGSSFERTVRVVAQSVEPSIQSGTLTPEEGRSRTSSIVSSEPDLEDEPGFADRVRGLSTESPFKATEGVLQYCFDMTFGTMVMGVSDFLMNLALTVGKAVGASFSLLGALFGVMIFSEAVKEASLFAFEVCTVNIESNAAGIFESLLRIPPVVGPILNYAIRSLVPKSDDRLYV